MDLRSSVLPLRLLPVWILSALPALAAQDPTPTPAQDPEPTEESDEVPIGQQIGQVAGEAEREVMWRAPTAEEWAAPTLIPWQRTWADAVKVSLDTGDPIMICVNMDGEIASEHYAGVRYRQPEVAALYEGYVTVIASVYRHNPRDYDDEGRRIPCPRFGHVTCAEHITLEPIVFEKYLDGRRVAPRHIMVELDGAEVFDVFYAFDTASVFQSVNDGVVGRINPVPQIERPEPTIEEWVKSVAVKDREAVEEAYRKGAKVERRQLLHAAVSAGPDSPLDLLRMAIFGLDVELAKLAREALAQSQDPAAVDLIAEALKVPMETPEREGLIIALERLSELDERAGTLAVVYRGLGEKSESVDVEAWSRGLQGSSMNVVAYEREALESRLLSKERAAAERAEDGQLTLEAAEAALALAVDPATLKNLAADRTQATKFHRLMYEDVRHKALRAEELGAGGWRVDAAIAVAESSLGNYGVAFGRAKLAVEAMPIGAQSWSAMAALSIFVDGRRQSISMRLRRGEEWPPNWLTDVHSAFAVLAQHPHGMDVHVIQHHDFLRRLGAGGPATQVLDMGLERFSESWGLHERLRSSLLREKGIDSLAKRYDQMLAKPGASANLHMMAGYAGLVAGEFHRRVSDAEAGLVSYTRAQKLYRSAMALAAEDPSVEHNAVHFIAIAHAGRARILLDAERDREAVDELLLAFSTCPAAANVLDGLNLSAAATSTTLMARLRNNGSKELQSKLQAGLDTLDPTQLELPAFEREGGNAPNTGGRAFRRRNGGR